MSLSTALPAGPLRHVSQPSDRAHLEAQKSPIWVLVPWIVTASLKLAFP